MIRSSSRLLVSALVVPALALFAASASAAEVYDGRLFDSGVGLDAPAATAPADLAKMAWFVGDWDVSHELNRQGEVTRSEGRARVTFMNRGHGIMERTRIADFDGAGHHMATMAFHNVDAQGVWSVGEGNSWTEVIFLWSGAWSDADEHESGTGALVVHGAIRPGGGPLLMLSRRTYRSHSEDHAEMVNDISTDLGVTWLTVLRRTYRRHVPTSGDGEFFPVREDVGLPAPDRAAEAAQFDFLLGEFDATHWLLQPDGQERRWQSNATAVHVLGGKAILEFDSFDGDPSLPAATSILRIYNQSMRRWESLFLPNRTHRPLYFGGVQEADRIVLHLFDAQTGPGSLFQWTFFDVRDDAYRWKGMASRDRGTTWGATWAIDFVRKGTEADPSPSEITTTSADGTVLYGDLYRAAQPASPTVVLFHQAGGDARGEYADIATRLHAEGYEVIAWDVRGGGDRFGQVNRTVEGLDLAWDGTYCDAYPDLEAALRRSWELGSGAPIFAVGSSYSAALVVRLAAEHSNDLAGVAAFSPASGQMDDCAVETWLPEAQAPLLVFRPTAELEYPNVAAQRDLLTEAGIEVFVAEGAHGASMLRERRSEAGAAATWERLLAFLDDPTATQTSEP